MQSRARIGAAPDWRPPSLRSVLFDLDGTLLDTAGDIALALNRSLQDTGRPPIAPELVRNWIGRGSPILIRRAIESLEGAADPAECEAILQAFLAHYAALESAGESTARAYPGAAATLHGLRSRGLLLGVVTNKHLAIARAALEGADLLGVLQIVVGGDSCTGRKPDPEPLLHACRKLGVGAREAMMVGDSNNDVLAARAAGMPVVCVTYGYNEGRPASELACDGLIDRLDELPAMLLGS